MKHAFVTAPGYVAFAKKLSAQPGAACKTPKVDVLELGSDVAGSRSRSWNLYVATPPCGKDDAYAAVVEYQGNVDDPNAALVKRSFDDGQAQDTVEVFAKPLNDAIKLAVDTVL